MFLTPGEEDNKALYLDIVHEASGEAMTVPLTYEDNRGFATLTINGVHYHLERVTQNELTTDYKVDQDPDYLPRSDKTGRCYLLAPFSE